MLHKRGTKLKAFTLVECMIVVAIIALLAAVALPNFLRARKRTQAARILNDLRQIDQAITQYAIEKGKNSGAPVDWEDVKIYLKTSSALYYSGGKDLLGNAFDEPPLTVDLAPVVPAATFDALSSVIPREYWSPFIQ